MTSPLSVKRRKVNNATQTLTKPFVSPLRSANVQQAAPHDNSHAVSQQYAPSALGHTIKAADSSPLSPNSPKRPDITPAKPPPTRKPLFVASSKRTDPTEIAAQKALTALELQIKALRREIDVLRQAAHISSSAIDAELEALTNKWLLVSQQAAEELFGTVKERVCRMGGAAAWRESEKRKFERANGLGDFAPEPEEDDDADCEFDSQGEELPEEEQEFRRAEKRRVKQEVLDAMDEPSEREEAAGNGKSEDWQDTGSDDDAFTMDMMLRSLNIDLRVIGYDKAAQRWIS